MNNRYGEITQVIEISDVKEVSARLGSNWSLLDIVVVDRELTDDEIDNIVPDGIVPVIVPTLVRKPLYIMGR